MKRLSALFLAFLLLLTGCSSGAEPSLSEMLGTQSESSYSSPFGFVIDTADLYIFSDEDLASVNGIDSFTPEAMMTQIDLGNAVTVFAAAPGGDSSVTLSLFPASGLSEDIRTAADYAEYGLSVMPGKMEDAGYTDIEAKLLSVILDDGEHPAVLCTAKLTEEVSYYLLQVCFREGDWMGGLSLSSLQSEEALRELLTQVTSTN